jgi:trehalose 6-phosphate synthase
MNERIDVESAYWASLLSHTPLGIMTDLDGTLLPFAETPDAAKPSPELRALVRDVATLEGVSLAIVSGRPRDALDAFFPAPREALLVAEHGAWRTGPSGWEATVGVDKAAVESLVLELRRLLEKYPNAVLERKTWSIAFHYRKLPTHRKLELLVELEAIVEPWLEAHPEFERLPGAEVVEIRPWAAKKSSAVAWMKERLGPNARLVVLGDDTTDEDMFEAASREHDAAIHVGAEDEPTAARWRLRSTEEAHGFLRQIVEVRTSAAPQSVGPLPSSVARPGATPYRLLVLSNRLPELRSASTRQKNVGGLVSALRPVLERRGGVWLGWSGRTHGHDDQATPVTVNTAQGLSLASIDFPEEWHRLYYNGFSNSALWPLMHSFPGRVRFNHAEWRSYVRVNEVFAAIAAKLVSPRDAVWAHDYHLLLLARALRAHGHTGPLGLFQHIPFPGPDIFFLLPWAEELLKALLEFDLVGFHTKGHVANLLHCMAALPGAHVEPSRVTLGARTMNVGHFPLGIIPEDFQQEDESLASVEIEGLIRAIGTSRMVLGVDRLDYTKGIPERIEAFGRLLALHPDWRKNVCLVQVSVPSRADVPEYAKQRALVENAVGRINGEYGEADWVPIRYLYRSYGRRELTQLYRAAHVGYVTPLRDGMNLVAKEFVAAQDPENPGALLLSRFAGAADELVDAVLTNPWDREGTAHDLDRALKMPLAERKARHAALLAATQRTTALTWAEDFLSAMAPPAA